MAEESGGAWKRISSERLLENPYFNVRSDRLELPDGAVKENYYVIERPDAAIVFPVTEDGESDPGAPVPAAVGDDGVRIAGWPSRARRGTRSRRPARALRGDRIYRGRGGKSWAPWPLHPSLKDNWAYLFLARGVTRSSEQDLDEYERLDLVRMSLEELPGLVYSGGIVSSSGVAAAMLALDRLGVLKGVLNGGA